MPGTILCLWGDKIDVTREDVRDAIKKVRRYKIMCEQCGRRDDCNGCGLCALQLSCPSEAATAAECPYFRPEDSCIYFKEE